MLRRPGLVVLVLALGTPAGLAGAGAASASTTLVEVQPGNGATLERAPSEAVLTFATELDPDRASATVAAPGEQARDVRADVDGASLVIGLPSAGDGDYVVGYSVAAAGAPPGQGQVEGTVGFSVAADGARREVGGSGPWAVFGVLAVLGLLGALVVTARRWRNAG